MKLLDQEKEQNTSSADDNEEDFSLTWLVLKERLKNKCLVNKDGSQVKRAYWLTEEQKLQAFIRGPCSPTLFMSGISGTALQVEIDCEVVQKENPEIFKNCGWNTCAEYYVPGVYAKPATEYRIWIAHLYDPMSLFSIGDHNKERSKCFGSLMEQVENPKSTRVEDRFKSPEGVRVTIVGDTPGTKEGRQCGNSANSDLFAGRDMDKFDNTVQCQRHLQEISISMGYQPGITQQYIPYDWRRSVSEIRTDIRIKNAFRKLKKYTGKKAVFMTHSYSGLHGLYALSKFDQQFKDDHIQQWVPTGVPFTGASQLIKSQLNADDGLFQDLLGVHQKYISVGVQVYSQRKTAKFSNSLFDMFPKNVQEVHKDDDWMKEILKRVEYEEQTLRQGKEWEGEIPFPEFPKSTDKCRPDNMKDTACQTFFFDELKDPLVTIEDDKYYLTYQDMHDMLEKYDIHPKALEMMKDNWQQSFVDLDNPGVRVTNVYGAYDDVQIQYEWKENPVPHTEKYEMFLPEIVQNRNGDQVVSANSGLRGPMKWLYEHAHANGDKSKKPVKIVENCSIYKQTTDVNDETNENGEKTFTKSGYHGLKCVCLKDGVTKNCSHAGIPADAYYLEFLTTLMVDQQISEYMAGGEQNMPKFDSHALQQDADDCPVVFPNGESIPFELEL